VRLGRMGEDVQRWSSATGRTKSGSSWFRRPRNGVRAGQGRAGGGRAARKDQSAAAEQAVARGQGPGSSARRFGKGRRGRPGPEVLPNTSLKRGPPPAKRLAREAPVVYHALRGPSALPPGSA
jgi:hypothetical protein